MSILWWLISLGIAAAIIYYVFSARGEVVDVNDGEPIHAGVDEEYGEEIDADLRQGEVDEELEAKVVPALVDEDTALTNLASVDAAGALAGRPGDRGHDDEEYGAELPVDAEPMAARDVDERDSHEEEGMNRLENNADRDALLENQTYMDADQVKRETRSEKKHHHKRKRRH